MIGQIVLWILFMYGFISFIQDLVTEFTYKKFNKNVKVYICVKDFNNEYENLEREISKVKWQFKNISINLVNYDEEVDNNQIRDFFDGTRINVYSKSEFAKSIHNMV